jgi:hypothetical protein
MNFRPLREFLPSKPQNKAAQHRLSGARQPAVPFSALKIWC